MRLLALLPLLLLLLLITASAVLSPTVAQVTTSPAAVDVALPAGQRGEVSVEVTNAGSEPLTLFAVPLREGGAPGDVGALLFHSALGTVNDAFGMTMIKPTSQIFAADYGGGGCTFEYTHDLTLIREFESPHTGFSTNTTGITWMPPEHAPPDYPEGTLWWLDLDTDCEQSMCTVVSTLLIEGDLDGVETGRTVELTLGPGVPDIPSFDRGIPVGLVYDPDAVGPSGAPGLFYYTDANNEDFYAVDIEGIVGEGYPVPLTDYDPGTQRSLAFNSTLDATYGPDGGTYFEVGFVIPGDTRFERVVVTDRDGQNTGVETPLGGLANPEGEGELIEVNGVLRSRIDPSVLYLAVRSQVAGNFPPQWIYAIRAAPLPPRWLRASAAAPASLDLVAGETSILTVRLNTEGLGLGSYAAQVSLRAGGPNGVEVAVVPVALRVMEATAEEIDREPSGALLSVYPNPVSSWATVALTLPRTEMVRLTVYDVLGREVAVLHDGPLNEGMHELTLEGHHLLAGVYVVRVTGNRGSATRRISIVR